MRESVVVGMEDLLSCSNFVLQGNVIEDGLMMDGRVFGCKFGFDVISIVKKFFSSVWKNEADRF